MVFEVRQIVMSYGLEWINAWLDLNQLQIDWYVDKYVFCIKII